MSGMDTDIRVSVVVPVYNAAATAVESIRSCLEQSVPPFEVIVVDDGSTDNTAILMAGTFGDRIKLIILPKNGGPSAARNEGVKAASGTHIAFQDADDTWHPDKLKLLTSALHRNPAILFLWHPYTLKPLLPLREEVQLKAEPFSMLQLLWSNPIGTPCVLIKREEVLPFNTAMRHMEDYDLFLRIAAKTGTWKLPIALTRLGRPILSVGGQSSGRWAMRRGELQAYRHLIKAKPQYAALYPLLVFFALAKHAAKAAFPPRRNY